MFIHKAVIALLSFLQFFVSICIAHWPEFEYELLHVLYLYLSRWRVSTLELMFDVVQLQCSFVLSLMIVFVNQSYDSATPATEPFLTFFTVIFIALLYFVERFLYTRYRMQSIEATQKYAQEREKEIQTAKSMESSI